jgi:hypothetical protein
MSYIVKWFIQNHEQFNDINNLNPIFEIDTAKYSGHIDSDFTKRCIDQIINNGNGNSLQLYPQGNFIKSESSLDYYTFENSAHALKESLDYRVDGYIPYNNPFSFTSIYKFKVKYDSSYDFDGDNSPINLLRIHGTSSLITESEKDLIGIKEIYLLYYPSRFIININAYLYDENNPYSNTYVSNSYDISNSNTPNSINDVPLTVTVETFTSGLPLSFRISIKNSITTAQLASTIVFDKCKLKVAEFPQTFTIGAQTNYNYFENTSHNANYLQSLGYIKPYSSSDSISPVILNMSYHSYYSGRWEGNYTNNPTEFRRRTSNSGATIESPFINDPSVIEQKEEEYRKLHSFITEIDDIETNINILEEQREWITPTDISVDLEVKVDELNEDLLDIEINVSIDFDQDLFNISLDIKEDLNQDLISINLDAAKDINKDLFPIDISIREDISKDLLNPITLDIGKDIIPVDINIYLTTSNPFRSLEEVEDYINKTYLGNKQAADDFQLLMKVTDYSYWPVEFSIDNNYHIHIKPDPIYLGVPLYASTNKQFLYGKYVLNDD